MQDVTATGFDLSPVQESLYAISKDNASFRCQRAVLIEGPVDTARVQGAVDQVAAHYEILHTNFRLLAGRRRLLQIVVPAPTSVLEVEDLRGAETWESRVHEFLDNLRNEPLDLDSGALVRFHLLHLDGERHILSITASSLCADSKTLAVLTGDILGLYGGTKDLPEEPLQYADFSAWQRDLLQSDEVDAQEGREYWRQLEAGAPSLRRLPYERGSTDFVPGVFEVSFSSDLTDALSRFEGTQPGVEAFLLSCWTSFIGRLTGQFDGLVGRVVDGRSYDEISGSPGLFAKTLPVSWSFERTLTFAMAQAQVAETIERGNQWQDYYDANDGSVRPSLGFTWESGLPGVEVDSLRWTPYLQSSWTYAFALNLVCTDTACKIAARIQYNAAQFRDADIARLTDQFALFAAGAAAEPNSSLGDLPLLPSSERDRLLEWNSTESDYPAGDAIHRLFELQAERTPHALALICGKDRFTFAELNAKSNKIAHLLKSKGVVSNQAVALCLERSADMIVGLLAVLKAGGFYVPLAADLPPARLQSLLEQTRPAVVLTQSPLKDRLSGWDGTLLSLDMDSAQWEGLEDGNLAHAGSPDDLAYVLFTSGSTGVPKGVEVLQRGIVNYTAFIGARTGLSTPGGRETWNIGTVSTLSADLGNTSIFPSLAYGGCLHVIHYETAMEGVRFEEYLKANPLDMLKITPSHLRALLSSTDGDILPRKYLFIGGEALTWDLLADIRKRGGCEVINHYGPTETTVGSLTYAASTGSLGPGDSATVPIGTPIANTRIYVLDEGGQLLPFGIPGELYIGGAGLAAGYLSQPEATAERFVPDPFFADGRMYRTGDRVRRLPDGNVEFLGRIDDQVKIRGFRVEPGEVESVVRRHPDVRNAAVLVTEDNQGSKRLACYYVSGSTGPGAERIREFLLSHLPEYMIPSSLTLLQELPLTPNGKVDRSALLASEGAAHTPVYEAGRNPTEVQLAEIWEQILKQERVGIHDDFFELGGHSLLMTQILARIRTVFQVQLALHTLFDNPTVATLAAVIDGEKASGSEEEEMRLMLAELEGLSDEEVNRLLGEEAHH